MSDSLIRSLLFCALAFLAVVAAEFLVVIVLSEVSGYRMTPRGPGWVVLPVLGAIAGWRYGRGGRGGARSAPPVRIFDTNDPRTRYWLAASAIWVLVVIAFHLMVNPYGYYWSDDEWFQLFLTLLIPPFLARVSLVLLDWAKGTENK